MAVTVELQQETCKESRKITQTADCFCCRLTLQVTRVKLLKMVLKTIFVLFLVTLLVLVLVNFCNGNASQKHELKMVSTVEWNAKPPKESLTRLDHPLKSVIIAHTLLHECFTRETCDEVMQNLQNIHMFNARYNFSQIAFNFVIMNDGSVYEGNLIKI
jgi:hypothetical protein